MLSAVADPGFLGNLLDHLRRDEICEIWGDFERTPQKPRPTPSSRNVDVVFFWPRRVIHFHRTIRMPERHAWILTFFEPDQLHIYEGSFALIFVGTRRQQSGNGNGVPSLKHMLEFRIFVEHLTIEQFPRQSGCTEKNLWGAGCVLLNGHNRTRLVRC